MPPAPGMALQLISQPFSARELPCSHSRKLLPAMQLLACEVQVSACCDHKQAAIALASHRRRELGVHPQDALELSKRDMAAEEVELLDVERQMEEELVDEFKQVERVIATRVDAVEGDQRFLVKVRLGGLALLQKRLHAQMISHYGCFPCEKEVRRGCSLGLSCLFKPMCT